jgi:hypothetical protein
MIYRLFLAVLALFVAAAGCKKEEAAPAGETKAEAPKPEKKSGPFADFDLDLVKKRLQGAWVIRGQAWEVSGDQIKIFDGKEEKTRKLEVVAPCKIGLTNKTERGTSTDFLKYTTDGEKVFVGMGNAGIRQGDKIVACGFNAVLVHAGDKCTAFKEDFRGGWKDEPGECKIEKKGEEEMFIFKAGMSRGGLKIAGDALLSGQMEKNVAEKVASYEEAKAKLAK